MTNRGDVLQPVLAVHMHVTRNEREPGSVEPEGPVAGIRVASFKFETRPDSLARDTTNSSEMISRRAFYFLNALQSFRLEISICKDKHTRTSDCQALIIDYL
jgi:hypothetical protein